MKSMTGFSVIEKQLLCDMMFKVEIRSCNKKQLELKISLPNELLDLDVYLRKIVPVYISRGNVNLRISAELIGDKLKQGVNINKELIKYYIDSIRTISTENNIPYNPDLNHLIRLPNVIETSNTNMLTEDIIDEMLNVVKVCLEQFNQSREEEGAFLKNDITVRVNKLEELLNAIVPLSENLPSLAKEKLKTKIENEHLNLPDNEERLARELVVFADRMDVSEEITRLQSHIALFRKYLSEKLPVGRNIDFLIQEIMREINTLGVKSASVEITPYIVEFKTELEKIREQAQNVE